MIIIDSVERLRDCVREWRAAGQTIGLVPTMGNLHTGHLSLVDVARQKTDRVIVSIFVNPTQFGPGEDLDAYPRTLEADKKELEARQTDLLFIPSVETMYGDTLHQTTSVIVPALSDILCGVTRPGHFSGVATVVAKLFNQVQPDVAVFGEKDFQQLITIRQMAQDLAFPVDIIGVETSREADGLAMSSRNGYLTDEERNIAPLFYQTLKQVGHCMIEQKNSFEACHEAAMRTLSDAGFVPEYVEIRRQNDLKLPELDDKHLIILAAAKLGKARLIDNLKIEVE
ncbi:MAG: pantoate--beta-alanine ligase [Gammaproteobacteria bacterium]|nr:MAG: pantoate--beta-alanine ligase [Gammaproteobacteria bacterium]